MLNSLTVARQGPVFCKMNLEKNSPNNENLVTVAEFDRHFEICETIGIIA